MRSSASVRRAFTLLVCAALLGHRSAASERADTRAEVKAPAVTAPPEAFFEKFAARDREVARRFYKKYLDANGLSVAAGAEVADEALQRTYLIVTRMLAGRPDILQA